MRYSFFAVHRGASVVEYPTAGHVDAENITEACHTFAESHDMVFSEVTADLAWMLTADGADIGYKVSELH